MSSVALAKEDFFFAHLYLELSTKEIRLSFGEYLTTKQAVCLSYYRLGQTSLPIGEPLIGVSSVNSRLKLKSGEPTIAGGMETPGAQVFIIVRAEILERPAGPE